MQLYIAEILSFLCAPQSRIGSGSVYLYTFIKKTLIENKNYRDAIKEINNHIDDKDKCNEKLKKVCK